MVRRATFEEFTTLPNGSWEFGAGLNLIVGDNGVGKSHVLKAVYSLLKPTASPRVDLAKSALERAYAEKLRAVFLPDRLGRLVKRGRGRRTCTVSLDMAEPKRSVTIGFATNSESTVRVDRAPQIPLSANPVFFPTRELITLAGWFPPHYEQFAIPIEQTYSDTASMLGGAAFRGPREQQISTLLEPLERAMGGKVVLHGDTGRLYLKTAAETLELPLVAEGHRKLAMVARLIATGVLLKQGYLLWDEPETNLNPRLLRTIASTILDLADAGVQVFVATHSMFLIRELELLLSDRRATSAEARFFALAAADGTVVLEQGDTPDDMATIVALEAELQQSDRYLKADF